MKTLGLIGGLSWESTALYYRLINQQVQSSLGGLHSSRMVLFSFDFDEIAALQSAGNWVAATQRMVEAGLSLKAAGAEALVICANTMHLMAPEVEAATGLPLIHVADASGQEIQRCSLGTVGLIGTRFTMEMSFYKERLEERSDARVLIPDEADRQLVHQIIYDELCRGIVNPTSREQFHRVLARLKERGAAGAVLGCTELGLLVQGDEAEGLKLFDTTLIHADHAARYALQDDR
jgi:aspartate racemase